MSQREWQLAPHFRNFVRIPVEQALASDTPEMTPLENEHFAPNDCYSVVWRIACVGFLMVFVVMCVLIPLRWHRCRYWSGSNWWIVPRSFGVSWRVVRIETVLPALILPSVGIVSSCGSPGCCRSHRSRGACSSVVVTPSCIFIIWSPLSSFFPRPVNLLNRQPVIIR